MGKREDGGSVRKIQLFAPDEHIDTLSSNRFPGLSLQQKVTAEQANGVYEVYQIEANGEEVTIPYIEHHKTCGSMIVMKGSVEVKIGNDTTTAEYKSVIHVPPFMPHGMTLAKDTKIMAVYAGEGIKEGIDKDIHEPCELVNFASAPPLMPPVRKMEDNIEYNKLFPFYGMGNKVSPNDTNNLYQLETLEVDLSQQMPPGKPMLWELHNHYEHCETFILLEGYAEFTNPNGEILKMIPGSLCHCPVPVAHSLCVRESSLLMSMCNPPNYNMKLNQLITMLTYHANMMVTPEFFDYQLQWDKEFEHHCLATEYIGEIEAVDGHMLKLDVDGKTENVDMRTNLYMLEPEVGAKVRLYGFPVEGDIVIAWKAWQI